MSYMHAFYGCAVTHTHTERERHVPSSLIPTPNTQTPARTHTYRGNTEERLSNNNLNPKHG